MTYFLLLPLNLVFSVLAVMLAPILPLLCRDDGTLPEWLSWFGTFDAPHLVFDGSGEISADFADNKWPFLTNIDPPWLKLYLQRVFWLARNAGYGFAYDVCGYEYSVHTFQWVVDYSVDDEFFQFGYDADGYGWKLFFFLRYPFFDKLGLRVYLGWKVAKGTSGRAMLAMCVNPFRGNS